LVASEPTSSRPEEALQEEPEARVDALLAHSIDVPALAEAVERQEAPDAADTLERLEEDEAAQVLVAMEGQAAAEALAEMRGPLAAGVIEDLIDEGSLAYAAQLVGLMAPDDAADLTQALDGERQAALLGALPAGKAVALRQLIGYAEDTAGGLMTTDFLALRAEQTVEEATGAIRARELPEEVHELPVVDAGRLVGVISLRTLLISRADRRVGDIMARDVATIGPDLDQEEVAREFDRYDRFMLPVVDVHDRLLGIVTVDDVIDIIREEQTEDVQRTVGAGAEEAVYSGIAEKIRGRLPWLVVSFLLAIPASIVVLRFSGFVAELSILAVLMPIVAALAGNAGHQALAVTLRGIALAEVRAGRVWPLVRREAIVGLLNGLAVGGLVGLGVSVLSLEVESASWRLGVVVAVSMSMSMCTGTLAGASIPLIMRRFGADPAQSSAIFLIMITDAMAFLTFLGLAWTLRSSLLP
jgi:magnesium transporter